MLKICHVENFYEVIAGEMNSQKRVMVIPKWDSFDDKDLMNGYYRLRNDHIERLSKSGLNFTIIDENQINLDSKLTESNDDESVLSFEVRPSTVEDEIIIMLKD